ncbi:hypothetical protein BHE74_00003294 [Ensete ventricosum]|nr:hypothetical protein BHE74_00003294 [Ensete ventricosum]RZR80655.1 hypothetical protein BHM03_00006710 [Ensete ventricosum]
MTAFPPPASARVVRANVDGLPEERTEKREARGRGAHAVLSTRGRRPRGRRDCGGPPPPTPSPSATWYRRGVGQESAALGCLVVDGRHHVDRVTL